MSAARPLPNESSLIHGKRLGRRKPSKKPALKLSSYLTGSVPSHPASAEHFSKITDWGLYGNDRYGDCGPVSVANSRKLTSLYLTGTEQSPTQEDVFDLYRRSGNPAFDPNTDADDNGVDMQTMLEAVVKDGIGGTKALGFAKVNPSNHTEVDAAIAIFGFLLYGVNLEVAQQVQTDQRLWDYAASGEWGGHAILGGRYAESPTQLAERRGVVTWGEVVDMTDAFIDSQMEEAWVVIWPEHLDHPDFLAGVDLAAFASDYQAITGRSFPAPIPTPQPSPTPAESLTFNITNSDVIRHLRSAAGHKQESVDAWAEHHFMSYFRI